MQDELFLLATYFTTELEYSNARLEKEWRWSCMSDLKCLGRRMQPKKVREKSLWLVMLKHQNLNRQNVC